MKLLKYLPLLLLATSLHAQCTNYPVTPNFHLGLPPIGSIGPAWAQCVVGNFSALDADLAAANVLSTSASQQAAAANLLAQQALNIAGSAQAGGGPVPANAIMYVSPQGNDLNTGLRWDVSKKTVYGALIALPGGSASPPTRGSGTVFVADGSSANPTAGAGIWILSANDANYNTPPAGWLREGGASVAIIGVGCQVMPSNYAGGPVCNVVGGSTADTNHPGVWINGANGTHIENLAFSAGVGIKLAIQSNGNRNGGGVNKDFENVYASVPNIQGLGPVVDIGGNSFNNYFNHMSLNVPTANVVNISTVARASNVATITTTSTHHLTTGQHCGILGDSNGFNGSTYTGLIVTGANTFTVPNSGPNVSSTGSSGTVACDNSMAVVMDAGGSPIGIGLTHFTNSEYNNGGIRFWPEGASNESFDVNTVYIEDSVTPAVWVVPDAFTTITVKNVENADTSLASIVNDGNFPISVENSCPCLGPFSTPNTFNTQTVIPAIQGETGIINNFLRSNTNVAAAAPQAVRYANTVLSPSGWFLRGGLGTVATGAADRDGNSNAVSVTTTGSDLVTFTNAGTGQSVGDWLVGGVWAKQNVGSPVGSPAIINQLSLICSKTVNINGPYDGTQGAWEWYGVGCKVQQGGSGGNLFFEYQFLGSTSGQLYDPVFVQIPTGTLTDAEVMEFMQNLRGYSPSCTVGQVCDAIGAFSTLIPRTLYSAAGTPLPSCNAAAKGEQLTVSDATSPSYNGTYTSGGAITTPVVCNGASWLTH